MKNDKHRESGSKGVREREEEEEEEVLEEEKVKHGERKGDIGGGV